MSFSTSSAFKFSIVSLEEFSNVCEMIKIKKNCWLNVLDSCEVESKEKKEKNFLISKNLLLRYVKCVKNNFLKQNAIFF